MKESTRQLRIRLATPRAAVGGDVISSHYDDQEQEWFLHYQLGDQGVAVLPLGIADPIAVEAAAAAELDLITTHAPEIKPISELDSDQPGVYMDERDRHWYIWIPCLACQGFSFKLEMRQGQLTAADDSLEEQLQAIDQEKRLARLEGYRVLHWYQAEDGPACAGCVTDLVLSGSIEMPDQPYIWLDVHTQEWQLWCPGNGQGKSISLHLPSYTSEDDIQTAAKNLLYARRPLLD